MDLMQKWKDFTNDMNRKGIPIPTIRDPKNGLGSVTLTMMILSFNIWVISIVGKASNALGGMDPSQCLSMFVVCSGLYLGRKFQKDSAGKITMDDIAKDTVKETDVVVVNQN